MKKEKAELSIIIVTHNSIRHIEKCLQSIFDSLHECKFEIWIVDNNSSDETQQVIKKFPVHFILNDSNLGFSKAVNIGIQRSNGPFILLLNDDTEIQDNVFDELIGFLKKTPDAAVVGPLVLLPDGRPEPFGLKFPSLLKEFFHANPYFKSIFRPIVTAKQKDSRAQTMSIPSQVDYVTGACFLLRRTIIEQIGLLDEKYFIYVEEVDWCWRIKQAGWYIYSYPLVSIIHHFGQSTKQKPTHQTINWLLPHRYFSILYFFKKNYHINKYHFLRMIIIQGFALRLLYHWITNSIYPSRKKDSIKYIVEIISIAWRGI
jgi:GT2 family glycosyltransferase